MPPVVSIIIPTFQRAHLLSRAIASVLQQTYRRWELLVIDDGSTDDTVTAVAGIRTARLRYRHQLHQGASAARNRGIAEAQGTYLAFLDSDDAWCPSKLAQQLALFRRQPHLQVCYTEEQWIRRGRRVNPGNQHRKYAGWLYPYCLPRCIISPSSVMLHRSVFSHLGGFDPVLPACEDYDMWLRVSARYPVGLIRHPLIIKYGGHQDQLSRKYWGMDRFRIGALQRMLCAPTLSAPLRRLTYRELERKCRILMKGAFKRQKHTEYLYYQATITRARTQLRAAGINQLETHPEPGLHYTTPALPVNSDPG